MTLPQWLSQDLAQIPPLERRIVKPFGKKAQHFIATPPHLDSRITILEGSVRSAKTWAMNAKIILALCAYPVRGHRVLFGVTKQTIKHNVLDDLFEIVGPNQYTYNAQTGELWLLGTKWIVIGAKDEGSEKFVRGLTVGIAVGDELVLIPPSFVKMILNRMSPEGARFYATTNPDTPTHYVFTDLMHNKDLHKSRMITVIHFELDDNPYLTAHYKQYLKDLYKGVYYQRFVLGKWVIAEGGIYKDCFSERLFYDTKPWTMKNGEPGCVAPENLTRYGGYSEHFISVDCGVDHVQVYGDWYDDGKVAWLHRTYWWDSSVTMVQKTDAQYREDLQRFMGENSDAQVIIPPECASFDAELTLQSIWHTDADNEVDNGIKHVSSLLGMRLLRFRRPPENYHLVRLDKNPNYEPIMDHAGEVIHQMETYVWNEKKKLLGIEEPKKSDDDGPDMVRYFAKTKIPSWRLHLGEIAA